MPAFPLNPFIPIYGSLGISSFGLLLIAGAALAYLTAEPVMRRRFGEEGRKVFDLLVLAALIGLVAARLGNQLVSPDIAFNRPLSWIRLSESGVSLDAGFLGALLGAAWLLRRWGPRFWEFLDAVAAPVALGLALASLGSAALGRSTTLPWASEPLPGTTVHPVQVYYFLGYLLLAGFLYWQSERTDYPGQNPVSLLAVYGALRFAVGFFIEDLGVFGPLTYAQLLGLGWLVLSFLLGRRLAGEEAGHASRLFTEGGAGW